MKGGLPLLLEGFPSSISHTNDRKEGDNNVYYIFGFNSVWNIHCRSRRIVLYIFTRRK